MALDIKPIEGMVALQLLEPLDEESGANKSAMATSSTPEDSYNEALYAIVVGVGPKGPIGVKKGDTVLCRGYARDGLKIGDDVVLVESYCIVGKVTSD
jgi:co-chaperonin GroES (HSP10)